MNFMKKIIALLLILILGVTLLAGCGGDKSDDTSGGNNNDDNNNNNGGEENAPLAGVWVHSWGYIYEFNEDGTGSWALSENDEEPMAFNYEDKGDKLVVTFKYLSDWGADENGYVYEDPKELRYSISGSQLSIQDSASEDMMTFNKK